MDENRRQYSRSAILTMTLAIFSTIAANPAYTVGVWKDLTPPGANSASGHGFSAMAIDHKNANIIYAGQCGGGVWKSTNGGESWAALGSPSQIGGYDDTVKTYIDNPVFIEADPDNSQHLYCNDAEWCGAGQSGGFWESLDGGTTWKMPSGFNAATRLPGNTRDCGRFDVDPGDFNHVLISMRYTTDDQFGFLESKDGFKTFTLHPWPLTVPGNTKGLNFLRDPVHGIGDGNTWLVSTEGPGLYRTTDAGAHWTNVAANISGIHGGISRHCYTQTGVLYSGGYPYPTRSTDNGVTWQQITSLYGYWQSVVTDGHTLYTVPEGNNVTVYTSPETDGLKWTAQTKTFGGYPLLTFDPVGGILYATGTDGVEGLKVAGSTVAAAPARLSRQVTSHGERTRLTIVNSTMRWGGVMSKLTLPGRELYNVMGARVDRSIGAVGLAVSR